MTKKTRATARITTRTTTRTKAQTPFTSISTHAVHTVFLTASTVVVVIIGVLMTLMYVEIHSSRKDRVDTIEFKKLQAEVKNIWGANTSITDMLVSSQDKINRLERRLEEAERWILISRYGTGTGKRKR